MVRYYTPIFNTHRNTENGKTIFTPVTNDNTYLLKVFCYLFNDA